VARHVNLLSPRQPSVPDGGGGTIPVETDGDHPAAAQLEIYPRPQRGRALFDAGSFTIVVAITARDTDAGVLLDRHDVLRAVVGRREIREHPQRPP
jgi:hypothetical protein